MNIWVGQIGQAVKAAHNVKCVNGTKNIIGGFLGQNDQLLFFLAYGSFGAAELKLDRTVEIEPSFGMFDV